MPVVVNMDQQLAARLDHTAKVLNRLLAIRSSLDHAQGAEQAHTMIDTLIAKATQVHQVCFGTVDRQVMFKGFALHNLQHLVGQIDRQSPMSDLSQFHQRSTGPTSKISHQ